MSRKPKETAPAEQRGFGAIGSMIVGPNSPDHVKAAQEARAKAENERVIAERDRRFAELTEKIGEDDDIMFAPGRTDNLCGVIREDGWHYIICTENTAVEGKSRPNYALLLSERYEVAKLPDGSDANWPEISKAIMRVPQERYDRYRMSVEMQVAAANGATLERPYHAKGGNESTFVTEEDHKLAAVGAAQLGIPVPQV